MPQPTSKFIYHRNTLQVLTWFNIANDTQPHYQPPIQVSPKVTSTTRSQFAVFLTFYWKTLCANLDNQKYENIGKEAENDQLPASRGVLLKVQTDAQLKEIMEFEGSWLKSLSDDASKPLFNDVLFPYKQLVLYLTQPRVDEQMPVMFVSELMQAHVPLVLLWLTLYGVELSNTPEQLASKSTTTCLDVLTQIRDQHPWLYEQLRAKCLALSTSVFNALTSSSYRKLEKRDSNSPFRFINNIYPLTLFYCDTSSTGVPYKPSYIDNLLYMQEELWRFYPPRATVNLVRQNPDNNINGYTTVQHEFCSSNEMFKEFLLNFGGMVNVAVTMTVDINLLWMKLGSSKDEYYQLPFQGDLYYNHDTLTNPWVKRPIQPIATKQQLSDLHTLWSYCIRYIAALPLFDQSATTHAFEFETFSPPPFIEIRKINTFDTDATTPSRFTVSHPSLDDDDDSPVYILPILGSVSVEIEDDSDNCKYVNVVPPGWLLQLAPNCVAKETESVRRTYLTRPNLKNAKDVGETWVLIFRKNKDNKVPFMRPSDNNVIEDVV
jgi:hypothetical protein